NLLQFDDIRIGVRNFNVVFGSNPFADFSGAIYVASAGVHFNQGKPFSASITDRQDATDRNPDGSDNTEAIHLELVFDQGKVTALRFKVDTMAIDLGGYVTITARDFTLDTGATDTQELVSFAAVGAKVNIGSLELTGEARNFAFLGNGHFEAKKGF